MTAKKIKTAVQVVFSCAFWNMVSSPTGKSHEKKTQNCLSTLAFYFWDFLQNCCVKQFCKNWDLLFLTPSWSFLQAKRCQWLVSKDKKLWAPLISCFFSCVNRLGQKFGILHQHPCKPFGVFGEVWDSSKKRPSIVNIFSSTRLQN